MRDTLIDVTRLLGRSMQGRLPTGIDRVGLAYIEHFRHRSRALVRWRGQGLELTDAASDCLFARLLCPRERCGPGTRRLITRGAIAALGRPVASGRLLINTGHSGLEGPGYAKILRQRQARLVFLLHDLVPISHPEYCRKGEGERHNARLDNMLALAAGIITNSEATLAELHRHTQGSARPLPPTAAAPLAPGLPATAPGPRPMETPYFVILGTIEPRKNHWLLLHIWRHIVADLGDAAPRLVIIGQRGWECENVDDMLERCEPLRGMVIEHPRCSDAELITYLHHAQALLFPSFAEGYGMPLIEALSLGVPVLASDLPVFEEIAGGVPEYIDPLDGRRWREVIEAYTPADSVPRAVQLARLKGFRVPDWAAHFAKVDALLEPLRGAPPG